MVSGAPWISSSFGETRMTAIPFPSIDPRYASSMEGGGDLAVVLSDRPEVRAVIRTMASPSWAASWVQSDGTFVSPHRGFDVGSYTDADDRARAVTLRSPIDAGTFRFDTSDQLPPSVAGQLYPALLGYVTDPDASAEETLASVEAAWLEYEATSLAG